MTLIQILLAVASILIAVGGAMLSQHGRNLIDRGMRLSHHWAHPSMQLTRDPDLVIAMCNEGLTMQIRGRRRAVRGLFISIFGMALSFVVLLWVVVSQ